MKFKKCVVCNRRIQGLVHALLVPDRHNSCAATAEFRHDLLELMDQFPRLTYKRLANDLKVPEVTLYRWVCRARNARLARRWRAAQDAKMLERMEKEDGRASQQ